jgi:hypothetical protein
MTSPANRSRSKPKLTMVKTETLIDSVQILKRVRRWLWLETAVMVLAGAIAMAQTTKVEQVRLLRARDISFEIVANAQITAQAQVLSDPERLVIDVPDAAMGLGLHKLLVNRGVVKDVRVGLFSTSPPITRIVVDWSAPMHYRLIPSGKTVVVKLSDATLENEQHAAAARRPPLAVSVTKAGLRVERLRLFNDKGVKLEITANGPIAPLAQFVPNPDRLVVDIPNTRPGAALHSLPVGRWGVKSVRTGLLSNKPPVTRVVVDLDALQSYQISASDNAVIVRLGVQDVIPPAREPQVLAAVKIPASLPVPDASRVATLLQLPAPPLVVAMPKVAVTYRAGLLGIQADRATLAEVLYEVRRKTGADIAIPPGAEQDRVVANLGPAGPNEVLSSLLNGSRFNFILMASPGDPNQLRSVLLTPKEPSIQRPLADSGQSANGDTGLPATNSTSAYDFQDKNKLRSESSPTPVAGTMPPPAPQPSSTPQAPSEPSPSQSSTPQPTAPQQPSTLPTDQDLSTPRPVGPDQPPPPGV